MKAKKPVEIKKKAIRLGPNKNKMEALKKQKKTASVDLPPKSEMKECKKHGPIDLFMELKYKAEIYKKVCFKCWADKVTRGLQDFK